MQTKVKGIDFHKHEWKTVRNLTTSHFQMKAVFGWKGMENFVFEKKSTSKIETESKASIQKSIFGVPYQKMVLRNSLFYRHHEDRILCKHHTERLPHSLSQHRISDRGSHISTRQ